MYVNVPSVSVAVCVHMSVRTPAAGDVRPRCRACDGTLASAHGVSQDCWAALEAFYEHGEGCVRESDDSAAALRFMMRLNGGGRTHVASSSASWHQSCVVACYVF